MSSSISKTPAIMPRQTMRGHTNWVNGVARLPDGRHIITGSSDGSLRLWDLESGAQIGEEWRDETNTVWSMALSPNGKTIASGSGDGDYSLRLWDVKTRKVTSKWTGHISTVCALCWRADGERVVSGSWDWTARVWDVDSGKTDSSKLATGGQIEDAVKIWDAETGELLNTLKHDITVYSLTWTSDGKKLISGSLGPIRIFDTATWQQIAILRGHTDQVNVISLSQDNRILASASWDKTACLWNLDTNLPVGPPLQHEGGLRSAALSPDGKVLVAGCQNKNAYAWDVHAILKKAGLEDLISSTTDVQTLMNSNAMPRPPIQARRLSQNLSDGVQNGAQHRPRRFIFSRRLPIVEVPTVQDRKPAQKSQQQAHATAPGAASMQPRPLPLWTRFILFLCCASLPHADGH